MNRFVGAVLQRHLVSHFAKAPMNVPTLLHRLGLSPLPVAAKIDRGRTTHRESGETAHLLAVAGAAEVFAPSGFLSVSGKIGSGDMVMVSEFTTT